MGPGHIWDNLRVLKTSSVLPFWLCACICHLVFLVYMPNDLISIRGITLLFSLFLTWPKIAWLFCFLVFFVFFCFQTTLFVCHCVEFLEVNVIVRKIWFHFSLVSTFLPSSIPINETCVPTCCVNVRSSCNKGALLWKVLKQLHHCTWVWEVKLVWLWDVILLSKDCQNGKLRNEGDLSGKDVLWFFSAITLWAWWMILAKHKSGSINIYDTHLCPI